MIGHLRVKSPWSQLGLFLFLLGTGVVLTSLVVAFIVLSRGFSLATINSLDWAKAGLTGTMKLVQAVSSITIFLIPALIFSLIVFTGKRLYFLGVRPAVKPQMYLLAMLSTVVSIPFVIWLGDLNELIPLPAWMTKMDESANKTIEAFLKGGSAVDVITNVFIIAFLPALCEEIFFRGMLQRIIIRICRDPWAGIIVTAVLFSAAHLQFEGFLPRAFLGVVLGALYWYSGSIWTSVLAHFVNNAIQVVAVSYAPQYVDKHPATPVFLSLVSGLGVVGILWVYRKLSNITYEKVYQPDELNRTNEFIA